MNTEHDLDVVVVGGGLAGLTAGAVAAGEGASVVVLDGHGLGGRARTTAVGGEARFNQGAHAIYRGGSGWKVLGSLGIVPTGQPPLTSAARGLHNGELVILPVGAVGLARTPLVGVRGKAQLARLMTALPKIDASMLAGRSFGQWFDDNDVDERVRAVIAAIARVATYDPDPTTLSAAVAVRQLQLAIDPGVLYLDGGWQQLVDALAARCTTRGVDVLDHRQVLRITRSEAGRWSIELADGDSMLARSVVIAAGGPGVSAQLLGDAAPAAWTGAAGSEIVAACLDLATRRQPAPPVVFGIDEPLYLSMHCPPANLAPKGTSIVHLMRYGGAQDAQTGRTELEGLAWRTGLNESDIVEQRYLHRMTVIHDRASVERGLAARPAVAADAAEGLFVAGDWVGPTGWLADASLASGEAAGLLAAAHARPRTSAVA